MVATQKEILDVTGITLDKEHTKEWRHFWGRQTRLLAENGLFADIGESCALIYRGDKLVEGFTMEDTPGNVEERLTALAKPGLRLVAV